MRALAVSLAACLLALPATSRAEPIKAKQSAEQLYATLYRGPWHELKRVPPKQ
jgi:hypothetical protein